MEQVMGKLEAIIVEVVEKAPQGSRTSKKARIELEALRPSSLLPLPCPLLPPQQGARHRQLRDMHHGSQWRRRRRIWGGYWREARRRVRDRELGQCHGRQGLGISWGGSAGCATARRQVTARRATVWTAACQTEAKDPSIAAKDHTAIAVVTALSVCQW